MAARDATEVAENRTAYERGRAHGTSPDYRHSREERLANESGITHLFRAMVKALGPKQEPGTDQGITFRDWARPAPGESINATVARITGLLIAGGGDIATTATLPVFGDGPKNPAHEIKVAAAPASDPELKTGKRQKNIGDALVKAFQDGVDPHKIAAMATSGRANPDAQTYISAALDEGVRLDDLYAKHGPAARDPKFGA